jgi:hypothetical protein
MLKQMEYKASIILNVEKMCPPIREIARISSQHQQSIRMICSSLRPLPETNLVT